MLKRGVVTTFEGVSSRELSENCLALRKRWRSVHDALLRDRLFGESTSALWRVSPFPFPLTPHDVSFFHSLGNHLLTFSRALESLYVESVQSRQPKWVHIYLDQGKPERLLEFGRMKRFRGLTPNVIRPDIILTEGGMSITELDSVPGGIGLTGSMSHVYAALGDTIVGGGDGMVRAFAEMVQFQMEDLPGCLAIVVSDEAESYRTEMKWVASRLYEWGLEAYCVHPHEVRFTEEGLMIPTPSGEKPVALVYRFFELFDLKNVSKSELVMYSAKKGKIVVTPPYKPWLEEKLALALLRHPILESFWIKALGDEGFGLLQRLIPQTWVLDPSPLPPSAIIPGLRLDGRAVSDWRPLALASQRHRRYVVKPSGFSALAWGSRGVSIGHDLSQPEWASILNNALASFPNTPYVLQEFHKGQQYDLSYFDEEADDFVQMAGRVRLSPYYFIKGNEVTLGGILATICPKDKKVIHGMREAIMAPCSIDSLVVHKVRPHMYGLS